MLVYEITVLDLVTNKTYEFKNDVYSVLASGTSTSYIPICDPDWCSQAGCLYDCDELREYNNDPGLFESTYGEIGETGTSLDCVP